MNAHALGSPSGNLSLRTISHRFALNLAFAVIVLASAVAASAAVSLPIEVFASDGATRIESASVTVPAVPVSATHLWLQVHGLSYQAKASVQVNGGAWIALGNATPELLVAEPGKRMGGIGGVFATLKMTVELPAGLVVNGAANTVRFRFNGTDGISMGFRVLAFNFLDIDGNRLLPESAFASDDPAAWQPPLNTPADIASGENLWRTRQLIESPLTNRVLLARCTDCHAQDGRDLKYFNFSNYSIIQRSRFHGLSQTEGGQIASYIRSLALPNPGRPWNPPYQPGPGLTSKPVSDWAGGAGIEWALEHESDAKPYLPGGGTSRDAILDGTRVKPRTIHEQPVTLQFLDWNHWLPRVHPKDAVGAANFAADVTWLRYAKLRDGLHGNLGVTPAAYTYGAMRGDFDQWMTSMSGSAASALWKNFAQVAGDYSNGGIAISGKEFSDKKYAFAVWFAVKQWEIMQEFNLEGLGRQFYGINGRDRQWFSNRHIFNISPHILGLLSGPPVTGDGNGLLTNAAFANLWYELQQQLNSGSRNAVQGGFGTIDWGYSNGLFGNIASATGFGEPTRATNFVLNSFEQADDGYGPDGRNGTPDDNSWWGWDLRDSTATCIRATTDNWSELPDAAPLVQTIFQVWLEKIGSYSLDRWAKGTGQDPNSTFYRPDATYVLPASLYRPIWPQGLALDIGDLRTKYATHEAVLNAMADFGKGMWPLNNWDLFKVTAVSPPAAPASLVATAAVERVKLTWASVPGALGYNVKRGDSATGPFLAVRLLSPLTSFTDRDLEAGRTYFYRVSANGARYEGTHSSVVSATPTNGLVARWRFDETGGGTATDDSATANHGMLISGPTRGTGVVGTGLTLNGSSQYVSLPYSLHRWLGRATTFTFWIKTTAVGNTGNVVTNPQVTGAIDGEGYQQDWGVLDSAGHIGLAMREGWSTTAQALYSTAAVNNGQWHHISMTRDPATGTAQIYVDGALSTSGTLRTGLRYAPRLRDLGRGMNFSSGYGYLNGSLDDVRVYNQVLSAAEVTAVFTDSSIPPTPPANVGPVAVNDSATTNESTPVSIAVLANDSDADAGPQPLSVQSATQPAHGTAEIVAGAILYTPNPGFYGAQDTFTYTISDGDLTASASVTVSVNSTATANNLLAAGLTGSAVGSGASGSSRVLANGTWEVNGTGAGTGGNADAFWFENLTQNGGFQLRVRMQSITGASDARAGLVLREGSGANARFVQLCVTPGGSTRYSSRSAAGAGSSGEQAAPLQNQSAFPNKWIMLQRIGDVVSIRVDDDNSSYTELAQVTLGGLGQSLQIGLFVAGGTGPGAARAVFSDYNLAAVSGWDGGAATQNWGDAANWNPDVVPTSSGLFNVVIPNGSGFIVKPNTNVVTGSPEDTGQRIGSITIGADATVLRAGIQDFFTGRNFSGGIARTSGVVSNAGTMRNDTTNSTWLFRWSPVTHANSGTIEARNTGAVVKFDFGTAGLTNSGGVLKATLGGKVSFSSSVVVTGGTVSSDAISQIENFGDNTLANFTGVQITNAGTWLHQQTSAATAGRTGQGIFNGTTAFTNTGTFKLRQAMTSGDANTQTALMELRGAAEFINQPGAGVIITNESTAATPASTGSRIARLDVAETTALFTNFGSVTITDSLATAGLNVRAELRSAAPLVNRGQITLTGSRSYLTMTGTEPYQQIAGATTLAGGATITATTTSIEGGVLGGSGKVAGDVAFGALGLFAAQLASNATSNLVEVTGAVTLDGALQIGADAGYTPAPGTEFRIMSATGGFAGSFATVPQYYRVIARGTDLIVQRDSPPTIAQAAAASPSVVTDATTQLSVLGADDGGETNLTYTWHVIGTPPGTVTLTGNGTNQSKTTVATFNTPGTYQFQVTVSDLSTLLATDAVSVTVQGSVNLWRNAHFTLGELSQPTISGLLADPDFDGFSNLLEYALGLDPRSREAANRRPITDTQTGYLRLTFTRPRPAPSDIIYEVEVHGSLATGSWVVVPFDGPPNDNGNGTETLSARDTAPTTGGPRFIRLRVRIPGP